MMDSFLYHIKKGLPFIITIILLLFVPAVMFIRENRFSFFDHSIHHRTPLQEQHDKILVADSLKRTDNIIGMKKDSLSKSSNYGNPEFLKVTRGTYHIISGSFEFFENAKQASENYQRRGFKTSIISDDNRNGVEIKLVSVKSFNNRKQAEDYLKDFKEKSDPTAWIYTKK